MAVELPEAAGPEAEAAAGRALEKAAAEARTILLEHGMLERASRMELRLGGGGRGPSWVAAEPEAGALISQAAALRPSWRGGQLGGPAGAAASRLKRGFGFVLMADRCSAEAAVAYGNGRLMLGRRAVRVDWAGGGKARRRL